MRTRTMWATIPLFIFFTMLLMGQSTQYRWFDCATEGFIQQVTYYQVSSAPADLVCDQLHKISHMLHRVRDDRQTNLWQTMTVYTAYNFIILGRPRLQGGKAIMVHVVCWGLPLLLTTLQTTVAPGAFHEDLFESELRGIGWCGVDSQRRIVKAVFVNTPQLISVSAYAQFYYYIHQKVDPEIDVMFESTAKLSTSKNAKLMSLEEARKDAYVQETAKQLRLQMSAYMLSFLTNTILSLVGDNLSDPSSGASDANLLLQTGVVSCQGFLMAIVYARTSNKSLLTAYFDTAGDLMAMCSEEAAKKLTLKRALAKEAKARQLEARRRTKLTKPSVLANIQNVAVIFYQTVLLYPVSVWVWVPMGFIAENTSNKSYIFIGLVIWSIASVFPIYAFSLVGAQTSNMSDQGMQNIAQGFALFVVLISASAVYANRYTHNLLMIERPCRYKGSMRNLFGPTQGFRFASARNSMSFFTLCLEFFQTFGAF